MATDAYLVAVRDGQGMATGYSRCSMCNAEFSADPGNGDQLAVIFAVHVGHVHGSRQMPIEGVGETAARVVDAAMRNLPRKR